MWAQNDIFKLLIYLFYFETLIIVSKKLFIEKFFVSFIQKSGAKIIGCRSKMTSTGHQKLMC